MDRHSPKTTSPFSSSHPGFLGAFFAICSALFLGEVLFRGGAYLLRDVLTFHHPWQMAVRDAVRGGHLPLWNHANGCGMPLLANLQSGVFYPFHALGWVVPFDRALSLEMWIHLTLAGSLAAHFFARTVGLSPAAALLGGAGFAWGTWTLSYLEFPMKLGSALWLPLLWTGTYNSMVRGRLAGAAVVALATALSLFAGYPQLTFLALASTALLIAFLATTAWKAESSPVARVQRLFAAPFGIGLGFLVAAIQILPTREMTALSSKVAAYPAEVALSRSLPPQALVGIVDPFFLGFPGFDRFWGGEIAEFAFGAFYIGFMALPLLLEFALSRIRRSRPAPSGAPASFTSTGSPHAPQAAWGRFFAVGLGLSVLLALGRHGGLSSLLLEFFPGYGSMRWPATATFLVSAFLASIAALTFDEILRRRRVPLLISAGLATLGVLFVLLSLFGGGAPANALRSFQLQNAPEIQFAAHASSHHEWLGSLLPRGILLVLAGAASFTLRRNVARLAPMLILLVVADLFLAFRSFHLPHAKGFYDRRPAELASLASEVGTHRIFTPRNTDQLGNFLSGVRTETPFDWAQRLMLCNANVPQGIAQASACDPLAPRRCEAFAQIFTDPKAPWEIKERIFDLWDAALLLEVEGVRPQDVPHLTAPHAGLSTSRHSPRWGRAILLSHWQAATNPESVLGQLLSPNHDPASTSILEPEALADIPQPSPSLVLTPGEPVRIESRHGTIRAQVTASSPGLLRIQETWAPGWRAKVNGEETPVHRADFQFMAVFVPAGNCRVELTYRPQSFEHGAWLSLVGIFAVAATTWFGRGPRRRDLKVVAGGPR